MLKSFRILRNILFFVFLAHFFCGCATYYEKSISFQEPYIRGNFDQANKALDKNKRAKTGKDRLLYFFQKGVVLQMLNKYEESNEYFEQAYIFGEDYRKNYSQKVASYLINPQVETYPGEDFELVLIHYYKALNFLFLEKYEEALVECRRMDNRLNQLNDRYEKHKNKYKRDAFIHNFMGIIYEASNDVNNAFIAYRNAYEIYQKDYSTNFGVQAPKQLKLDLLRTASLNGFTDELRQYEKQFNITYQAETEKKGSLVFFWHNGLGPVKDEWSVNFFIVKGLAGNVTFVNEELGLSFPFPLPKNEKSNGLGDLKIIRAAFPKYLERKPYYRSADLQVGNKNYPLEIGENINEIAFKTLEDRMIREFSNTLIRLAFKQLVEYEARQRNQGLGTLLSVVNAISEKSDTRNWQSLPYSISYARIPLEKGDNKLKFTGHSPQGSQKLTKEFQFQGKEGYTKFYIFNTLETIGLSH